MSLRHMRKILGATKLPTPDASDEEYEPGVVKSSKFTFAGLEVNTSCSEPEPEPEESEKETKTEHKVKKKKKNKKKKGHKVPIKSDGSDESELDEVERIKREVDAMLGVAEPAPQCSVADLPPQDEVMSVQLKHLNYENEVRWKFGPEIEDDPEARRARKNARKFIKKFIIIPMDKHLPTFSRTGLTMTVDRKENGITYFIFNHSEDYQKLRHRYLKFRLYELSAVPHTMYEAQKNFQIESLLECCSAMFTLERVTEAKNILEQCIAYLQYIAHPSFIPLDNTIRLEYKILENRMFHGGVLKLLYLLSNKACHRTALELAKMLMNLDPLDPLAVLLVIDILAIRAQEYQWLIEAVAKWSKERNAHHLCNIAYSHALAQFHVATKNKADTAYATSLLESAIISFPLVVPQVLENASYKSNEPFMTHYFFTLFAQSTSTRMLKEIITMYTKLTTSKWREASVLKWVVSTAKGFVEKYDADPEVKERVKKASKERVMRFRVWPDEVYRHMTTVYPMHALIFDNWMPSSIFLADPQDPRPPKDTVNRYKYDLHPPPPASRNAILELIQSIAPDH